MSRTAQQLEELAQRASPYGFVTAVESESMPSGLNEDIIRAISAKKHEPQFTLDWRLPAHRPRITLERAAAGPPGGSITYPPTHYQHIGHHSLPHPFTRPIQHNT